MAKLGKLEHVRQWQEGASTSSTFVSELVLDRDKHTVTYGYAHVDSKMRRKRKRFDNAEDAMGYFAMEARAARKMKGEIVKGADIELPPPRPGPPVTKEELESAYDTIEGRPHKGAFFREVWCHVPGMEDAFYEFIEGLGDPKRHPAAKTLERHEKDFVKSDVGILVRFLESLDEDTRLEAAAEMRRVLREAGG